MADTLIPYALAYYRALEETHATQFFHPRPMARLFANQDEANIWQTRSSDLDYQAWTASLETLQHSPLWEATSRRESNGFAIPSCGYLDTIPLLETLTKQANTLQTTFTYKEIQTTPTGVTFRNHTAPLAIFAEGHLVTNNPWFNYAPHKPAKGLIGTIQSSLYPTPNPKNPEPILLKQKFLIPRHNGTITVGATYNWNDASDTPDENGIQELETFLNAHLGENWKWIDIKAGVRPATAGAYPIIGQHPEHPQLISFNGFGSKGAMQIPYFANALVEHLYENSSLPAEVLPFRFIKKTSNKPKRWIATDIAKEKVLQHLVGDELAIDATCGNGHDTQWLCEAVGENGHVFAYDLQEQAISTTRQRLEKSNLQNQVTLHQTSHANLLETIPPEHHGNISAIVFNLGYLPGSDESLITKPDTTLRALTASLQLLKLNGILSVTLYPYHQGGSDETTQVLAWLKALPTDQYKTKIIEHPQQNPKSPFPIFVEKK